MKSQRVETCSKVSRKTKEAKEKPDSFVLIERLRTNCHAIKIKIKRTTSCSNLGAKARETSHGSVELSSVKPLKTIKIVLKTICMMPVELD